MQRFSLRLPSNRTAASTPQPITALIVLIEDNPADVTLVREALEEHGIVGELVVVPDGEKAIQMIQDIEAGKASCPDLFIVDLNIPKKPGREVVEYMRQTSACNQVAVVILSSSDSSKDKEDAKRLGARQYVRKPSRLSEFLSLGAVFKSILNSSRE